MTFVFSGWRRARRAQKWQLFADLVIQPRSPRRVIGLATRVDPPTQVCAAGSWREPSIRVAASRA